MSGTRPKQRLKSDSKRKNFKMGSSYGSVATPKEAKSQDFDPWDQLRIQHSASDLETLAASRKLAAKQRAAQNAFHPTVRSKSHPLVRHCRRIMREQLRKREGVMRVEGIKMTATAIEYGWTPDIILCGPRQAADLLKCVPGLTKEDLTIASEEVVESVLLQPRLDPLLAVGPAPSRPRPHMPKRAMLLGVQDPTNLGSLIRTGAALGVTSVYLMPGVSFTCAFAGAMAVLCAHGVRVFLWVGPKCGCAHAVFLCCVSMSSAHFASDTNFVRVSMCAAGVIALLTHRCMRLSVCIAVSGSV